MLHRRHVLTRFAGAAAAAAWPWPTRAGALPHGAFEAHGVAAVLKAIGAGPAQPSSEVGLQVADLVEDGSTVEVAVGTRLAGVRHLLVMVEKNPGALAAVFEINDAVEPQFTLRLKVAESSAIQVAALMADQRVFYARKAVAVTLGGCGEGEAAGEAPRPPQPSKLRAQAKGGGGALVRVLMSHEMESGQRKDATGRLIPAWHISDVTVSLNGQPAFATQWGAAVSRNPFLQFTLRQARAGDKLAVAWLDNRGARRSDETVIA